ncbi:MAG: FtsX-like permease family protein [Verrucomicrobiales bacterium]
MSLFRHLFRHPLLTLGNVLGVALGVAVFLAIQTGNRASSRAFAAGVDLVSGKAQAELRAPGGGLDESVFPTWREASEVEAATPIVEGFATLPGRPGEFVRLLGVELFSVAPFQTAAFKPEAWTGFDADAFLARPGQLLVSAPVARDLGWSAGQVVELEVNGSRVTATVLHVVPESAIEGSAGAGAGERVVLLDIAWAQDMLGQRGRVQAIQFLLREPGKLDAFLREAPNRYPVPPGASLAAPSSRTRQIQTMVEGFQLNLNALAMVSMLVGVFLVFNTISASTVRRRKEIGILRSLGAGKAMVMRHFLLEAVVLAVPGIALGLWAGHHLAGVLVSGIAETLSSRYLLTRIEGAPFDMAAAGLAAAYGIAATLLGAWWPAREAAGVDPVLALNPGHALDPHGQRRGGWTKLCLCFALATPVLAWLALARWPVLAFAACLTCVLAFACLVPSAARFLTGGLERILQGRGGIVTLGTEAFARSLHRTGVTMAALLASVSMLVGVSTMVGSFRQSVDEWVGGSLDADLYVSPASNETLGMRSFFPDEALRRLQARGDLLGRQDYREEPVDLPGYGPTILTAVAADRARKFDILKSSEDDPFAALARPGQLFVNESFARKFRVAPGTEIRVPTPDGLVAMTVAAVFRDYSDDRGRIFMDHGEFMRVWNDRRVQSVAYRVAEGVDPSTVVPELRAQLADLGAFSIYTRSTLRKRILEIFDQTFAVTSVLRAISFGVAVIGVGLALLILVLERAREICLLRSLGAKSVQVIGIYLVQAAWIGLVAAVLGGACGLALAVLLVKVVNPAFFGWTIPPRPDWLEIALLPVWIMAVAILAGLYPSWRATRLQIAPELRTE